MTAIFVILVVGTGVSALTPPKEPEGDHQLTFVPIACGPNAHYERCSKICPPQNCSTLVDPLWLCENPGCKPGCSCDDGYYFNEEGICISKAECLAQCGPQERYVSDSTDCQRTCANYKVTAPRSLCKPYSGCVCQEGRVRLNDDATGACVLPKDCPSRRCPLHEHFEDCPSVCANETCISQNPNYKCLQPAIPLPCKGRCICNKGYLRDHYGNCIPKKRCPIKECPKNEVWRCASMCPLDSCKRLEPGYKCPPGIISVCIPACACKEGYLRNDDGICVPRDQCPSSIRCGINEIAVECKAYPPQTCESVYTLYKQIYDPPCISGCDCRPGYLKNKRNICVPSEYCPAVPPSQCGINQEYKECGSNCEPSCSDLDNPPKACTDVCVEGCFCKDGYRKDERGNCVTRSECPLPICNKPNEVAKDCGSYCEMRTCEDYNRTDISCPAVCVRGCFCRDGYVRNAYGVCIPKERCPSKPTCLQEHEEYQSCGSSCPDNCDNYMNPDRICTKQCVAGCNCKKGYVRNLKDGTCIKPEQCPSKDCPGQNEGLNYCASYCPVTCANRYTQGDWSCITLCREACDCIPGTLRNSTGACVPVEQCTPPVCRENERYLKCGTACPLTCDNYKKPPQICTQQCIEDCFCKDGYVRNRFGRCVKPENCEPTCPAGEKWNECSAHCQDTCENYQSSNRVCTYQCQSGCVCEEGTLRRKDGKCVRPAECTEPITCPPDQVFDPCSAHCEPTCEHHGPDRVCTAICKPGCKCGKGLVRRKDGKCVKLDQCNNDQCPVNEVYDPCIMPKCPPGKMCAQVCRPGCRCKDGYIRGKDGKCVNTAVCPVNEEYDPCTCPPGNMCTQEVCRPGCRCKDGYIRGKDGKCVTRCPVNEVYDPCINTCPPGKMCTQEVCRPGCRCKDGYNRGKNGKCVKPQCPANERWVDCVIALCAPLWCDQLGFPIACPGIAGPCDGGCVCNENEVRNSDGVCIPKHNCPSCNNDYNTTSGCGIHCGRQCTDYKNPPNCNIPMPCQYNGCECKEGYVYNPVIDRCVAPVDCPIPCKGDLYAEKVKCPNPCPATCARPTQPICPKACLKQGCQCRLGYVLDPNGKCVKPERCPDNLGCNGDPNAKIDSCVSLCEPTCGGEPRFCPALCRLGCKCKYGYVLSKSGKCIKREECPPTTSTEAPCETGLTRPTRNSGTTTGDTQTTADQHATTTDMHATGNIQVTSDAHATASGQESTASASSALILCPMNEIWINCKAGYCKPQYCREKDRVMDCPKVTKSCPGGCICKKGLLRNEDGDCIPEDQCPINKPCSDPNAIRKKCASHESCRATCAVPNSKVCPKICIINGCECKRGYVLSERNGKCVKIEECPKGNVTCNGDPNAEIMAFPPPCPSTCKTPNGLPGCLLIGLDVGCQCKPGYLKDDERKCILPNNCKGGNPCGKNATFSWCRADCPYNYCPKDDSRAIIACDPPYPCPSGCVCKLNYRRKSENDKRCILAPDCPAVNCTRSNEVFSHCPSACLRENCEDINDQPTTCNTLVWNCDPRCICKKGHFRNSKGICVPAKDCPNKRPCEDPNAERLECAPDPSCRSTCAVPNPSQCLQRCAVNQCVCKKGYVLEKKGGKCIPVNQCPSGPCNGDANAYITDTPAPCPSTCDSPNASYRCRRLAPPVGCQCKDGYILPKINGKCIKADKCPGGNPCKGNTTFVSCTAHGCAGDYCPINDKPVITPCEIPYPCPSGCACKINYRLKSRDDQRCILSSECPRINCTRPNEIWDPCSSPCRPEICGDLDKPTTCNTLLLNCQPQCVCKKGYLRNTTIHGFDKPLCIPEKDCPNKRPCEDPNAERLECAPDPSCRSTCAVPNPSQCLQRCAVNQCVCKKGYVLENKGGKCIPVNQCPRDVPCNGDSNAVIKANPIPCPSSCSAPDASPRCKKYAPPVGCECKPGFMLNDKDKCVKPDQCPGGNPCGNNGTFVYCNVNCPNNDCPEGPSKGIIACSPPYPCPSGCACKNGYKRKSSSDRTCVLASDCPNYQCSDKNAERVKCAVADDCRPTCATPKPKPCISQICIRNECVCKKGYVLTKRGGKCIPLNQCPAPPIKCKANEVYNPCRIRCPPQTCASIYTDYDCRNATACEPGCDCKPEYLRNGTANDPCIPSHLCPTAPPVTPTCGINEHYEENRIKCELTCKNYHLESIMGPCQPVSGCFCDKDHVRNSNGVCIRKNRCPQNLVCPPNEVVSECYNSCHMTCATRLRSDGKMCHLACIETGCLCKEGYLRHQNGTCVPISECSPPRCNNDETYSKCGTACPLTCQNRGDNCTSCTDQCVDDCFCKKDLVRSDDGSCVKPKDCPPRTCADPNEIFEECPKTCPPSDGCSNLWSKFNCTNAVQCCKPQCRCRPGYLRKDNVCVPTKQCLTKN